MNFTVEIWEYWGKSVGKINFRGAAGPLFRPLDDSLFCPYVRSAPWPSLVELVLVETLLPITGLLHPCQGP